MDTQLELLAWDKDLWPNPDDYVGKASHNLAQLQAKNEFGIVLTHTFTECDNWPGCSASVLRYRIDFKPLIDRDE